MKTLLYDMDKLTAPLPYNMGMDNVAYGTVVKSTLWGGRLSKLTCIAGAGETLQYPEATIMLPLPLDLRRVVFEGYVGLTKQYYPSLTYWRIHKDGPVGANNCVQGWVRFYNGQLDYEDSAGSWQLLLDDMANTEVNMFCCSNEEDRGVGWNFFRHIVDFENGNYVSFQMNKHFCSLKDISLRTTTAYDNNCLKCGFDFKGASGSVAFLKSVKIYTELP